MQTLITIICFFALLLQIIFLVRCIKRKMRWIFAIVFELVSILISYAFILYYESLPTNGSAPGLMYFGEIFTLFGACILYAGMVVITVIFAIVISLLKMNNEDKNYFPAVLIVISVILMSWGLIKLVPDILNDINVRKVTATIVRYETYDNGEKHVIASYEVNGVNYERMIRSDRDDMENIQIDDKVVIRYNKREPILSDSYSDEEKSYIPSFLVSIVLIIIALKVRRNDSRKKQNEDVRTGESEDPPR